jgi:hypothetical protein
LRPEPYPVFGAFVPPQADETYISDSLIDKRTAADPKGSVGLPIMAWVPSGDAFSGGQGRLKAGCGQNCPPHSGPELPVFVLSEPQ